VINTSKTSGKNMEQMLKIRLLAVVE